VSKLAIEHYLAIVPGIEGISLRVANPYGSFQLRGAPVGVIANYARRLAHDMPIEVWGDGSVVRDYVAIEDVAAAFVAALCDAAVRPGVYNVGSGQGLRLGAIIALLFETAARQVAVRYLPARKFDVPAIVLDCSRLRESGAWRPRVELREGVRALWREAVRDAG
jgi:UDP-glucose 4-epimerase